MPGDILLKTTTPRHIAIVQDIDFLGDSRTVEEGNVTVIEATRGSNDEWKVMNTRKWSEMVNYTYFYSRRLTTY